MISKYYILLFIVINILLQFPAWSETTYKVNRRQKIDLSSLTVDGKVVSPGDFTVEIEEQVKSKFLYKRKRYNDKMKKNIQELF